MTTFVLVPGAWLGAWLWSEVQAVLESNGASATAVTLPGVAEKHSRCRNDVNLKGHVSAIVSCGELASEEVVLVGHSYGGIPVGQAAGQLAHRLRRVIYVDANVPHDGESMIARWSEAGRAFVERQLARNGGWWPPPHRSDYDGHELSIAAVDLLLDRATPHPGRTITDDAELAQPLAHLPTTYIKCLLAGATPTDDVQALLTAPQWRLATLETGHWPMLSRPRELAEILLNESGEMSGG